jgi:solute carrier family 35 protein E3
VGMFQISKMLIIPMQIIILYFLYGKKTSLMSMLTLTLLCIGVGLVVISDVEMNVLGTIYAFATVVSTAVAQVALPNVAEQNGVTPFQLLGLNSPFVALFIAIPSPFLDKYDVMELFGSSKTSNLAMVVLFITCNLGFHINMSSYIVLDRSGPITYQVLGQMKTISVIVFGSLIFSATIPIGYIVGILLAILASIWYSYLQYVEKLNVIREKHEIEATAIPIQEPAKMQRKINLKTKKTLYNSSCLSSFFGSIETGCLSNLKNPILPNLSL